MTTAKKKDANVHALELERGSLTAYILGTSPIILNRQSEKTKRELLLPAKKKTKSQREAVLKHEPLTEYRDSVYRVRGEHAPTRLILLSVMFKKAMMSAALDMPDATKSQIGRLTWVVGDTVSLYGRPQIYMTGVIQSGISRAPDIRTRAILPEWACQITIQYVKPMLNDTTVANLLAAGGMISGIGDYRQQKGAANYGQFELVTEDNARMKRVIELGTMEIQDEALASPEAYDQETEDLLEWYYVEVKRRGFKAVA